MHKISSSESGRAQLLEILKNLTQEWPGGGASSPAGCAKDAAVDDAQVECTLNLC